LNKPTRLLTGIDERAKYARRAQVEQSPNLVGLEAQRAGQKHRFRRRCGLQHRPYGREVDGRVLGVDNQKVIPGPAKYFRHGRIG
jgi:hypothetical protein